MSEDLIQQYLIHSYLYYVLDTCVISDFEFDRLCRIIDFDFNKIESPWKKFLIEHGDIAGIKGLSLLEEQYPKKIKELAREKLLEYEDLQKFVRN